MKALVFTALLSLYTYASEAKNIQHFPANYQDFLFQLRFLSKYSTHKIQLLTASFNHLSVVQYFTNKSLCNKEISLFIPQESISSDVKRLALFKNIKIYLLPVYPKDMPPTLFLFDEDATLSLSLPLEENVLKEGKGDFFIKYSKENITTKLLLLDNLKKTAISYFIP